MLAHLLFLDISPSRSGFPLTLTHTQTHTIGFSLYPPLTHTRILTHLSALPWLDFSFSVITGFLSTSYVTCCSHWPPPCFLLYHFSVTHLPLLLPPRANKAETHNMLFFFLSWLDQLLRLHRTHPGAIEFRWCFFLFCWVEII